MQIITPKILLSTALACGLSSAAFAEQAGDSPHDIAFVKADKNEDNHLSRDEFKRFAVLMAETGETEYAAMNAAENEDLHFSGKDIDSDGLLTKDELTYKVILNDQPAEIKPGYGSSKTGETPPSAVKPTDDDIPNDVEPTQE